MSGNSSDTGLNKANSDIANLPQAGANGSSSGKVYDPWHVASNFIPNRVSVTSSGQYQVTPGDKAQVTQDQALTIWQQLQKTPGAVNQFKRNLFWGGFYSGSNVASIGGDNITRDDIQAAYSMIDQAVNLNGRTDFFDYTTQLANQGRANGTPLNKALNPADTPAAQLRDFMSKNGLNLSEDFINENVRRIGSDQISLQDVTGYLRQTYLANSYPAWKDQIMSGTNVADIAQPYIQSMAQTLGVPVEGITLNDKYIKGALAGVTSDGKPTYKPLWQFEQELRQDPRWLQTDNAKDQIASAASNVVKMFGLQ
jgi:hypothetical protein